MGKQPDLLQNLAPPYKPEIALHIILAFNLLAFA